MNIKGFDKDLKCIGFQYEIGKTYSTGAKKEDLQLCTDTVFHYCDSIQKVHSYYSCNNNNRYCEIEALGDVVSDDNKSGSNKIKIIREITGDELNILLGKTNGNSGNWNSGYWNSGNWNSGDRNSGDRNSGDRNSGNWNSGYWNSGNWNSGYWNSGDRNSGDRNSGDRNSGDWNSGNRNSGDKNSGNWNSGYWNSGYWNSGDRNSGDKNSGYWNSCNHSSGVFCNIEPKIKIFNVDTDMTMTEFRNSIYHSAIWSSDFTLIEYKDDKLTTYAYKEACQNWWDNMSDENKKIIISMPNFNADVFHDITGIRLQKGEEK